jgi:hypothetical protein
MNAMHTLVFSLFLASKPGILHVRRQQANLEVEIEGQWSLRSGGGEWGWTQASTSNKERTKKRKKN